MLVGHREGYHSQYLCKITTLRAWGLSMTSDYTFTFSRHCTESFTILLYPCNYPIKCVLFSISYRWENWGGERYGHLSSEGGSQLLKPECASGAGSGSVQTTPELGGWCRVGLGRAGLPGDRTMPVPGCHREMHRYPSAHQRWKDLEQLKCFAWKLFGAFFFFFFELRVFWLQGVNRLSKWFCFLIAANDCGAIRFLPLCSCFWALSVLLLLFILFNSVR